MTKTIAGPAGGQQGLIAILIDCGVLPNVHVFLIAPGEPAGPVPHTVNGIPGGSTCVVTEVVDGGTSTVSVIGVGSGQSVVMTPAATQTADLTNSFDVVSTPTTPAPTTPPTAAPTPVPTGPIPTAPTAAPTSEPMVLPPTGSSDGGTIALVGLIVGALGAALFVVTRRRGALRER